MKKFLTMTVLCAAVAVGLSGCGIQRLGHVKQVIGAVTPVPGALAVAAVAKKFKDVKSFGEGIKVAIPNDPTNGGRALKVLADAGFFGLKEGVGVNGTPADIINNPKKVQIVEMEAAVLPRTLDDVDFAVINSNFAMGVGLNPAKDSLFTEAKDSPYANVVAIREGDNREEVKKLGAALTTPAVRDFIMKTYKGAVLPAF